MFQKQPYFEKLATDIEAHPDHIDRLPADIRKRFDLYVELRTQSELPPEKRPLRRALMDNKQKAEFITAQGKEKYLALPY